MATYYDALNDFHKLNELEPLATSAQIVYLHLLHLNNRNGNCGMVQITDRMLGYRTGIDKGTVTKAKQILKNRGLIDFKTNRNNPRAGTKYSLLKFLSESTTQSIVQSSRQNDRQNSGQNGGYSIYIHHSNDVESKEKEKETESKINHSFNQSRARVPIGGYSNSESGALDAVAAASGGGHRQTDNPVPILDNAELAKRVRTSTEWDEPVEEWLSRLWVSNNGAPVTAELLSYLQALFTKHGLEWLEGIIREAAASYSGEYRISLRYFKGCVERKLKGGDTNVRVAGQRRSLPARHNSRNQAGASSATGTSGKEPSYNWLYEDS